MMMMIMMMIIIIMIMAFSDALHLPDPILAKHEHSQVDKGFQSSNMVQPITSDVFVSALEIRLRTFVEGCLPPVVVKIQEDKSAGHL